MSLFSRLFQPKDATDPAAAPAPEGEAASTDEDIKIEEEAAPPSALPTSHIADQTDPMEVVALQESDGVETKLDTGELEAFVEADPEPESEEIDPEALSRPLLPPPPPLPPPRRSRRDRTGRHAKVKSTERIPGLTPPIRQPEPRETIDRREPLIVQALLRQVPGLEPLAIERLRAAGLSRLDALARASASEMVADAGLPEEVAKALVSIVRAFRRQTEGAPEVAPDRRSLAPLVSTLEAQNQAFDHAAQGWSADSLAAKRRLRRARTQAYLQVELALARMGEVDLLARLEPLPFAGKIEELRRHLNPPSPPAPQAPPGPGDDATAAPADAPLSNDEGTQHGRADT